MKKFKRLVAVITIFVTLPALVFYSGAHSGRTDSSGGHKDNKNKSGLGPYHYHCGGYPAHLHTNGVCPYAAGKTSTINSYSSKAEQKQPTKKQVSSVEIANAPKELTMGQVVSCMGIAYPNDVENKDLTWKSEDSRVATVSQDGVVTALAAGETIITAAADNGVESSFTVKVLEIPVSKITIINAPKEMACRDEMQLKVSVEPENATDKSIIWSTSNKDIADITLDGKLNTKSQGRTIISAKNKNFEASFDLAVKDIEPISITIENSEERIEKGKNIVLSAIVFPDDAHDKTVQWSTSNDTVATVKDGVVTGKNDGKTTVTVQTANGVSGSVEIEVYSPSWTYPIMAATFVAAGGGIALYKRKRKQENK